MFALNYFFGYELPKALALSHRLMNSDALTVEMETAHFSD
jgi:butyryl-CoA dehydrogenase